MSDDTRGRAPHVLTKEHQARLAESEAARAKNPNRMGPDATKPKAKKETKAKEDD